jgi:hypothetical protein
MPVQKPLVAALLAAITILPACQSISPEEMRIRDEQSCQRYGFRLGTDAMAQCLLDIDLDRRAESRSMQAQMRNDMFRQPVFIERRVIIERR